MIAALTVQLDSLLDGVYIKRVQYFFWKRSHHKSFSPENISFFTFLCCFFLFALLKTPHGTLNNY